MNGRTIALLTLFVSLLLIGAASADWAVVEEASTFDGGTAEDVVVIERTTVLTGAEQAGSLFAVGLASMVVAGFTVRWVLAGGALVLLGGLGTVEAYLGRPDVGETTSAPLIALVAALGLLVLGIAAVAAGLRSRRQPPAPQGAPPAGAGVVPSRFTVEAVRGDVEIPHVQMDEWDLAVADEDDVTDDQDQHP